MFFKKDQKNKFSKTLIVISLITFPEFSIAEVAQNTAVKNPPHNLNNTNSRWEDKIIDPHFYDDPYRVSLFSTQNNEDSERLLSQTYSVFGLSLATVAALGAMPSSITKWQEENDDEDSPSLFHKWSDNVTNGPVWDRDEWYLNYLAHPYFGGVFYQSARKSGYRQWDAFIYSFMMSSFCWEYGIEAFAEAPSIQDLVVTPVLGWVVGEWAFNTEQQIWLNGGTIWGSEILGNTSLFLLDPVDSIGRNLNLLFGNDIIKAGTGYFTFQQAKLPYGNKTESKIGLNINYRFGVDNSPAQKQISGKRNKHSSYQRMVADPVNTGIIGLSAGPVWLALDEKWQLNNTFGEQYSLGLYFTRSFSLDLQYTTAIIDKKQGNEQLTYEHYGLNTQYYFNTQSKWRPFVTAGVGERMFKKEKTTKQIQFNGGFGLHYKINKNWAIQSDWRHYYSTRSNTNVDQLGSAIIYRFANGEGIL